MLTLGLDTSGATCSVCLLEGEDVRASESKTIGRGHDAHLAPMVQRVLTSHSVKPSQLDTIAVCVGPGSFTGVRVGVAFARAFAISLPCTAVGITATRALIEGIPKGPETVALLEAKKRPPDVSFWCEVFKDGETVMSPFEIDMEQIAGHFGSETTAFVLPREITSVPDIVSAAKRVNGCVDAETVALASRDDASRREPKPVYVRAPDAVLPSSS